MTPPTDRSRENLVKVFTARDEMEGRMIQELLDGAGIESLINSETAPGLFPSSFGQLGKQDIFVAESQASAARELLSELPGTGREVA